MRRVVLVGGPIASGKTTVSHAAATELRQEQISAAVVDVDVIYEMLEPRGSTSGAPAVWKRARRLAGRVAEAILADGAAVVFVEGGFLVPAERADLGVDADLVVLRSSAHEALRRVSGDPLRGISRDEAFLRRHYEAVLPLFAELPTDALVIDTEQLGALEAGRAVASFATTTTCRRGPAA